MATPQLPVVSGRECVKMLGKAAVPSARCISRASACEIARAKARGYNLRTTSKWRGRGALPCILSKDVD